MIPYAHHLEFIPIYILLRLLCTSHNSFVSAICYVLQPSHKNPRGSTQSDLQSFRSLSTLFIQRPLSVVYQSSRFTSWATESWILTYCLPSLDFYSLTAYAYFPTSASGYIPPLIYLINSRLAFLLFYGAILTFLTSPSMSCINFISALIDLTTAVTLLLFFTIDRVTMNILKVGLLVRCRLVILDPFEVLSGAMQCDQIQSKLWGGSTTVYLNNLFLWSVEFFLVYVSLFTWGVDCSDVSLSFLCIVSAPAIFAINR